MSINTGNSDLTLDKALETYREVLDQKIKAATSAKNAAVEVRNSALDQLRNKTCNYLKLQSTKDLYLRIDQCISIAAYKESELVKANVDAIIKETEQLKKQMAQASKTLKSLKTEACVIKEQSSNLVDCCFKKDKDKFPETYDKLCEATDFELKLGAIKIKGRSAAEMAELTFLASISVSGIQGFANVDSLKNYSEELVATIGKLEGDVTQNCKDLDESITTTIQERTILVTTLADAKYTSKDAACEESALCNTWNKSCDPCNEAKDDPQEGKKALEVICGKFKSDLGDGNSNGDPVKKTPQQNGVEY